MILRYAKILFLVLLSQTIVAQMQVDWQQCFCSMDGDEAWDVAPVADGYLVIGMQSGGDGQVTCSDAGSAWLLKIDGMGNLVRQKCYFDRNAYRMFNEFEGSNLYIVGAAWIDPYPDEGNLWVSKIDSVGNIIWERSLGNDIGVSSYNFYGNPTNDGGCIATVDIFSQGGDITNWYGGYDGWVVKLDSLGNTEWDFTVGSQNADAVNGVTQTLDNGYIITGYGRPDGISGNITNPSYTSSASDVVIYKIDSMGNPEWNKTYGGSYSDHATRAISLPDGYLIAGGATSDDGYCEGCGWHEGYYQTGDRAADIWLIRTDLNGEIIWQKCYGGSQTESVSRVFPTSDGGFVVFGNTRSFDGDVVGNPSLGNERSIWIFKIDSLSNLIWQQCIGGSRSENVHGVIKHSDYNYTVAGEMFYSLSGDVNCSNFIYASSYNYWVFGISDTTVNVTETPQLNDNINIYPNPANSILNIDFPNYYNIQNTKIEIMDINGRTMLKSNPVSISTQLYIKELNNGLYLVKIQNNKTLFTKKIIIQ